MKKTIKILVAIIALVAVVAASMWFFQNSTIAVLEPKGLIAREQSKLLIAATLIMLIIVIPVFVLTFGIAWKYREGNKKAAYRPEWDGNSKLEAAWWGIPFALIAVLSVMIWTSSHALDPYKSIESDKKPLTVQVVALQWKWLFLYPEENIATVNYLHIPKDRPISLYNSADAPMSSLWIPQLGGQIYAMNGMTSRLHLLADETGSYYGASANINGKGFAGMNFEAKVSEEAEFEAWLASVKRAPDFLSLEAYQELAEPSEDVEPILYGGFEDGLFDTVRMKYMMPGMNKEGSHSHEGGH